MEDVVDDVDTKRFNLLSIMISSPFRILYRYNCLFGYSISSGPSCAFITYKMQTFFREVPKEGSRIANFSLPLNRYYLMGWNLNDAGMMQGKGSRRFLYRDFVLFMRSLKKPNVLQGIKRRNVIRR